MSIGGARPSLTPALSAFPALFKPPKYTLRRPASSAPVERNFSPSGLIMRPQKAKLSSEMLEILVYATAESKVLFGNVRNPCLLEI